MDPLILDSSTHGLDDGTLRDLLFGSAQRSGQTFEEGTLRSAMSNKKELDPKDPPQKKVSVSYIDMCCIYISVCISMFYVSASMHIDKYSYIYMHLALHLCSALYSYVYGHECIYIIQSI